MDKPTNISRRAALLGGALSGLAFAAPALATVPHAAPAVSPELLGLINSLTEAERAKDQTIAAWDVAEAALEADLAERPIRIRLQLYLAELHTVDGFYTPKGLRAHIRHEYATRLARHERYRAKHPKAAPLMGSPERLKAELARLWELAEPQFADYSRRWRKHGLTATGNASSVAWERLDASRAALFAYRPQSLAESHAVAAMVLARCEATGKWYGFDVDLLLRMLAGVN